MSQIATTAAEANVIRLTLDKIRAEANAGAAEKKAKSTIATRKKALAKAVEGLDLEVLGKVDEAAKTYVDQIATIDAEPHALADTEALALAEEYNRLRLLAEFLDTRKDAIKQAIFGHIDVTVGAGEKGEVKVEQAGITLRREGGGQADPAIDVDGLVEALGDDADGLFEEVHIPARVERTFSEDRLIELAAKRPEVLETVREHLVPGKARPEKFVVREIK